MKQQLIALSIGPVQEFIAAARRTRDLWFGSYMLSEVSRAAAVGLQSPARDEHAQVQLIFPHLIGDDQEAEGVANKILAVSTAGMDVRGAVARARAAAENRWRSFCAQCFEDVGRWVNRDIWDQQVDDVLEFYAAWVEFDDSQYSAARAKVELLLSARKALRDFRPAVGVSGIAKSSLDGARESVLWFDERHRERDSRHIKGVKIGEHLDVVGVVKRVGRGSSAAKAFPSVVQVAVGPWVRGIVAGADAAAAQLHRVAAAASALGLVEMRGHGLYKQFPFDASALVLSRVDEVVQEAASRNGAASLDLVATYKAELARLYKLSGEPQPYLAAVAADGDRMGEFMASLTTADMHRQVSHRLAKFSTHAREILEHRHGVCIYAGGDDVLGFVPLDECLLVARELHEAFANDIGELDQKVPTLSVGVAIGHFLEPMEDLLNLVRQAESKAKGSNRDGLAVAVQTRSGGEPLFVRDQWRCELDSRMRDYADAWARGELSNRLPYSIRELYQTYANWKVEDADQFQSMLRADLRRILGRRRTSSGERRQGIDVDAWVSEIHDLEDLSKLADAMLAARLIGRAVAQAGAGNRPSEVIV